jgi:hypothetical protein
MGGLTYRQNQGMGQDRGKAASHLGGGGGGAGRRAQTCQCSTPTAQAGPTCTRVERWRWVGPSEWTAASKTSAPSRGRESQQCGRGGRVGGAKKMQQPIRRCESVGVGEGGAAGRPVSADAPRTCSDLRSSTPPLCCQTPYCTVVGGEHNWGARGRQGKVRHQG